MQHFLALLLARELGVELAHVPYRGGLVAMQAAAAGEVAAAVSTEARARPLTQAGKLRVLATTGRDRSPFYPAVSTFREAGVDAMTRQEWFGAFVPARTPTAPQIAHLAEQIQAALSEADVRETWTKTGLMVDVSDARSARGVDAARTRLLGTDSQGQRVHPRDVTGIEAANRKPSSRRCTSRSQRMLGRQPHVGSCPRLKHRHPPPHAHKRRIAAIRHRRAFLLLRQLHPVAHRHHFSRDRHRNFGGRA